MSEAFNLEMVVSLNETDAQGKPNGRGLIIDNAHILNFTIYEDMFATSIVGKMEFLDKDNIFDNFRKNPKSYNCISVFWGEGFTKEAFFQIYNLESSQGDKGNPKIKKVVVYLADYYFARYQEMKVSFGWAKEYAIRPSKSILVDALQRFGDIRIDNLEPANEQFESFNIGYQTCIDFARYLLPRCSSNRHGLSGYLLFNSTKSTNREHFETSCITLSSVYDDALSKKGYMNIKGGEAETYTTENRHTYFFSDNQRGLGDYNKILDYTETGQIKALQKYLQNPLLVGYTSTKGKKNIFEIQSSQSLFNRSPFGKINKEQPEVFGTLGRIINSADTDKGVLANLNFDAFIKAMSLQETLTITVRGNASRYCGGIVDVIMPGYDTDQSPETQTFIVKSVTHNFSQRSSLPYTNRMTLMRATKEL